MSEREMFEREMFNLRWAADHWRDALAACEGDYADEHAEVELLEREVAWLRARIAYEADLLQQALSIRDRNESVDRFRALIAETDRQR